MYGVRDREAGYVIETGFATKEMAQKCISTYEESDIADGIYEKDFYEVFSYFDVYVNMMDDDIRESVHADLAPCTEEEFLAEYQKRHIAKYGEELTII